MTTVPTTTPRHAGFSVSVADVGSTASAFGRLHVTASAALRTAAGALARTSGAAGDDGPTVVWRARYDAVARATWAACATAVRTLHDVAATLVATGDAYLAADHASTPGSAGHPWTLAPVAPAVPTPAGPPSATGPPAEVVPSELQELHPSADVARLRQAGAAWTVLADALDDAVVAADRAFRTLTAHNTGATFSAMASFWAARYVLCGGDPLFNVAPIGARTLGRVCADLADLVETTRATADRAADDAAAEFAPLRVAAPPELLARARHPLARLVALFEVYGEPVLAGGYLALARHAYRDGLDELTRRLSPELEDRLDRAAGFPRPADPPGLTVADVGEVAGLGLRGSGWDGLPGERPSPDSVHVTAERRTHILDGDGPGRSGGGHRHGTGKPGKTEFPASWSDDKIIASVTSVARDPDSHLVRILQDNGRWRVRGEVDGVLTEVIVEPDGQLVTAYPVSGPGVVTNPRRSR